MRYYLMVAMVALATFASPTYGRDTKRTQFDYTVDDQCIRVTAYPDGLHRQQEKQTRYCPNGKLYEREIAYYNSEPAWQAITPHTDHCTWLSPESMWLCRASGRRFLCNAHSCVISK